MDWRPNPPDPEHRGRIEALLSTALAQRMRGELATALETLDRVLILDPRNFLALLSKGALFERTAAGRQAVEAYRRALAEAPPDSWLPPEMLAPLRRAREVVAAENAALADHLRRETEAVRAQHPEADLERFDESLAIFAGLTRAYTQRPLLLHYPRLPAIPFYDRALFPWLQELEAASAAIAQEAERARTRRFDRFTPYIAYPPGAPVDQWAELNHNPKWSTLFLWRDGRPQAEALALCPETAAALDKLPLAQQPGFAPTVVFSVLDARTSIPPHTGSTNTRLLCHLPLILPGPARFRVGNFIRPWRLGEAWVFDDTIEHEAWNEADEPRTIMIFDIWNPLLSTAERQLVSALLTAWQAFENRPSKGD